MCQLKEKIRSIKEDDFKLLAREEAMPLALEMLEQIGSTDSELRDDFIYSTLWRWIEWDYFDISELKKILGICLDDQHLYYHLNVQDEDAVFTRSFSVLIIASILSKDDAQHFLSFTDVYYIKERVYEYFAQERDIRGFVEGKGWAHAIAHAADCLDELAKSEHLDETDLAVMLEIIRLRVAEPVSVFVCDEQERLSKAVSTLINRDTVNEAILLDWIYSFREFDHRISFEMHINVKQFLRSLYFRLPENSPVSSKIKDTLHCLQTY